MAGAGRITQDSMEEVLCNGHLHLTTPFYYSPASLFVCEHTKSKKVLALPISLAATQGIEVSLCSCGYLDVSVPHVPSTYPIDSDTGNRV